MTDLLNALEVFHQSLPETQFEVTSESEKQSLIKWNMTPFVSWHYWRYLETGNPFHGNHVIHTLLNYGITIANDLVMDVAIGLANAENLDTLRGQFARDANTLWCFLLVQQLQTLCGCSGVDAYKRVCRANELERRPKVRQAKLGLKASTLKKEHIRMRDHPIYVITQHLLQHTLDHDIWRPSPDQITTFLENLPTTDDPQIIGSLEDKLVIKHSDLK